MSMSLPRCDFCGSRETAHPCTRVDIAARCRRNYGVLMDDGCQLNAVYGASVIQDRAEPTTQPHD